MDLCVCEVDVWRRREGWIRVWGLGTGFGYEETRNFLLPANTAED